MTENTENETEFQDIIDKLHLDSGRVYLWGDIDETSTKLTIDRMRYVFFHKKIRDIYLYIHTEGGDFECAAAIIDEIIGLQKLRANVYTVAIGKAYSAGALILAMGNKEMRYATPNASMMLHPLSLAQPEDYIANQKSLTAFTDQMYRNIMKLVAKRCGHTTKAGIRDFRESIKDGLWLSTGEALSKKLIDDVWNYSWEKDIKVINDK